MPHTPNVAILGAGLVGRLLAFELSKLNYSISLYEADDLHCAINGHPNYNQLNAAAYTAAGMIAPISETLESDLDTYKLGQASLKLWTNLVQQLNHNSDSKIFYQNTGSLIVCHPQDTAELIHFKRRVAQLSRSCDTRYKELDASEIIATEPNLGQGFTSGLLLEDEANIDNRHALQAMLDHCIKNNVQIIDKTKVEVENNRVISPTQTAVFDWVFDCRGMGAKKVLQTLRGVRGEVLRVHCPQVSLSRPVRLMHPRYQLYLVPKPDDQYVIGATQIESEDKSNMSIQSMLELCSAMYSITPAFAEGRILEQNTNLRPALSDNRASIQVNNQHISINGLFRHGFLVAPAIVETLIHWLNGNESPFYHTLFSTAE
jgi:glycine oxidase